MIFDDTVEHEAWNDSELPRGVLLLDFMRPGITGSVADHVPDEVQRYVAELFAANAAAHAEKGPRHHSDLRA